jgi:group I intron endonuclease
MKLCGIYRIYNTINNKSLVGQSKDILRRWSYHRWELLNNKHDNSYLQNSWNAHGGDNFRFEIVELIPIEKLDEAEINFIEKYKSLDKKFGYNLTAGGKRAAPTEESKIKNKMAHLGKKSSKKTKRKISKSNMGKHTWSEKMKLELSIKRKGKGNPAYGKKHSVEHKQKISKSMLGIVHSAEAIRKMSLAKKGKKLTEECKEKIRKSLKLYYKNNRSKSC